MRDHRDEIIAVTHALDAAGMVPNKSGNVSCRSAGGFADHAGRHSVPRAACRRTSSTLPLDAPVPATRAATVVRVAHARGDLSRAARRHGHRPHAQPARDGARLRRARHSAVPLHDRARRRRRALHAVRDVRHGGTGRIGGARTRGPACVPARQSRRDGDRQHAGARPCGGASRSRTSPGEYLAMLSAGLEPQLLDDAEMQKVIAKFTDYGRLG